LRRIDAVRQAAPPQAGVAALENGSPFFDKRTGPIIAVAAGPLSKARPMRSLGLVNYEANVTWNENTYLDKNNNRRYIAGQRHHPMLCTRRHRDRRGHWFWWHSHLVKRFFPNRVFDRPESRCQDFSK